jgi:hypothetical protein
MGVGFLLLNISERRIIRHLSEKTEPGDLLIRPVLLTIGDECGSMDHPKGVLCWEQALSWTWSGTKLFEVVHPETQTSRLLFLFCFIDGSGEGVYYGGHLVNVSSKAFFPFRATDTKRLCQE